ncbi:hypothetical protein AGMMS49545_11800 [Betaproteobacteria bacterium]|nr:hypothetical protein AGMMS49545_11800 [Betaproteobacteria bacterium]GHU44814.1 hypothetical protein AGMMS50289_14060 [Betaproteobacteria bacterium]
MTVIRAAKPPKVLIPDICHLIPDRPTGLKPDGNDGEIEEGAAPWERWRPRRRGWLRAKNLKTAGGDVGAPRGRYRGCRPVWGDVNGGGLVVPLVEAAFR